LDYRHFELQDLVAEALIAVEAKNYPTAAATLKKVLAWIESDWLATPSDAKSTPTPANSPDADAEDDDNDDD
jgi:hypothetical protein